MGKELDPIAVMGAGAVGCYYGGMLARAGHEVTLIGRAQHVEAIRKAGGLRFEEKGFDAVVPLRAAEEATAVRGAKLVLFTVKSGDTESAGRALAPHLERDAVILSLQNGVDNAERLAGVLGRGVIPAVDNVIGALWAKLIVNCAYNAISAIAQLPYGRMVQVEGIPAVMQQVVDECLAVARAARITVPGDLLKAVPKIAETMPGQFSSTAQDLARGKPTEIEHLNGYVAKKGEAHGVPTPVNRTLLALVKLLEGRSTGYHGSPGGDRAADKGRGQSGSKMGSG